MQRADEINKLNPKVAYYCRLYAIQQVCTSAIAEFWQRLPVKSAGCLLLSLDTVNIPAVELRRYSSLLWQPSSTKK